MNDKSNDKPLVSFNDNGLVLNYSVTRNEEIAYIDYSAEAVTFKQMPIPVDKIMEVLDYYKNSKEDFKKFKNQQKEINDESNNSEGSK
tara:strand:+ start:3342 stop:3605 length:264 start_codon:yes stop_codon:yes gene_type:complete